MKGNSAKGGSSLLLNLKIFCLVGRAAAPSASCEAREGEESPGRTGRGGG